MNVHELHVPCTTLVYCTDKRFGSHSVPLISRGCLSVYENNLDWFFRGVYGRGGLFWSSNVEHNGLELCPVYKNSILY